MGYSERDRGGYVRGVACGMGCSGRTQPEGGEAKTGQMGRQGDG